MQVQKNRILMSGFAPRIRMYMRTAKFGGASAVKALSETCSLTRH
jgi:hypothetical protein